MPFNFISFEKPKHIEMEDRINSEKFEYKIIELKEKGLFFTKFKLEDLEGELNFQGEHGWELASSFATDLDNNGRKEVVLIFKRRIIGNDPGHE